jgi:hypothetical protein
VSRIVDGLAVVLFCAAAVAMVLGVLALADGKDLSAFYWAGLGSVLLKAAVDVLRPLRNT